MTARVREFNFFLRDYVNLNSTRTKTLHSRVTAVNTFLTDHSDLGDVLGGDVVPQGSFAHKTIIRPHSGNDFDADVLVPMVEQDGWEPKHYTQALHKALQSSARYRDKAMLGKRCVKLDYAGDFHIDLVPFVTRDDGNTYITHRTRNEFIRQDPVAYTAWFEDNNRTTHGHLVRVVRLIKYLRDRSSVQVPSVVLSALLAERVRSFAGMNDYVNVAATLTSLVKALHEYVDPMSMPPWVDDRIGQNLADRLTQSGFENLKSQLKTWSKLMTEALEANADESVEKWRKLFGESFGTSIREASEGVALTASATSYYEKSPAPGEQDIQKDHGIRIALDPKQRVRVVGRMSPNRKGIGRYRPLGGSGNHVPLGRSLRFSIEGCTVAKPFDVYWKVRNAGEEAASRNMFRGEIRKRGEQITESSNFYGQHWVEAWIVKDGVALATDTQDVTILPN
ncbi:SMODS domain-containing nucleotidyltransferase [Arthrobacter crystallopoietes]|uniref:SMODS domain-containing nucleotidyltransferase n=1 Tax=Crystallibacter crystallopoietes TaxID=37928 RepID=UPI00111102AF|nr:nucleotidyltransferase [Arthrobacter crystallopoietes]